MYGEKAKSIGDTVGTPSNVLESKEPQMVKVLGRLEKVIQENYELTNLLSQHLQPVLSPESPTSSSEKVPTPNIPALPNRIRELSERLQSNNIFLNDILHRLEL